MLHSINSPIVVPRRCKNVTIIPRMKRVDPNSVPEIARRLRLLRKAVASNATELVRRTGITKNAWSNYENAFARIGVDAAMKLCDRFHLTLDWIFRGDERFLTKSFVDKLARAARELDEQDRLGHLGS